MRALVTGGVGLIGSHIADLLVREGWSVRVFDNLEPQTHRNGKPPWINAATEFVEADIRDRAATAAALRDIDVVFHEAAYGGYMPEIGKFVEVNSFGTAQMLEIIRDECLPVKKVIVASSQAVYSEGAANCPQHGLVFPKVRRTEQLNSGDFSVRCPRCDLKNTSVPTPEDAPIGGETVYAITKVDQERLVLTWGPADRHSGGCVALLLHVWTATINFQSVYWCDRDLLHQASNQSTTCTLRGRKPDARSVFR